MSLSNLLLSPLHSALLCFLNNLGRLLPQGLCTCCSNWSALLLYTYGLLLYFLQVKTTIQKLFCWWDLPWLPYLKFQHRCHSSCRPPTHCVCMYTCIHMHTHAYIFPFCFIFLLSSSYYLRYNIFHWYIELLCFLSASTIRMSASKRIHLDQF